MSVAPVGVAPSRRRRAVASPQVGRAACDWTIRNDTGGTGGLETSASSSISPRIRSGVVAGLAARHDLEQAAAGLDHRLRPGRPARRRRRTCPAPARRRASCGSASATSRRRSRRRRSRPGRARPSRRCRAARRVLVARAALPHHVEPQRGVRQEGGDVHRVLVALQRVEVLGERLPLPLDALVQRGAGDVLDALHQLDERRFLSGAHRGEARRRSCRATTVVTPWTGRRVEQAGPRWPARRSGCGCRRSPASRTDPGRRSPRSPRRPGRCRRRRCARR